MGSRPIEDQCTLPGVFGDTELVYLIIGQH